MDDTELHQFYLDLVGRLRESGVLCAITSGLACVHYRIAETTKDCDLLCHPEGFAKLLDVLATIEVSGYPCDYRGNLSPPLDARWHAGGWTSHFTWGRGPGAVTLDVFGRALRGSVPWENELAGLFANQHIVAEMKRTDRDKDWPFITSLGVQLLHAGDPRGWLHLYEEDTVRTMLGEYPCPADMVARRPALNFAVSQDARLRGALLVERLFWEHLDALRIRLLQAALRPYNTAVRRALREASPSLRESHAIRLNCAEQTLAVNPLVDYGVERLLEDARRDAVVGSGFPPEALKWLPDCHANFNYLLP
ncbi:MAG: hypothetical protein ABMA26_23210 [Limisphaerales bacterium]